MKKFTLCVLPAFALFFVSAAAGRADQFSQMAGSSQGYWVPAPTPPPPVAYYHGPPPGYYAGPFYDYGPYPYGPYYGGPYFGPSIFFGFGFGHGHGEYHHHH